MVPAVNAALRRVPVWCVYALGLMPGLWAWYAGFTDRLGADPLAELEHRTGLWALRFLIAALCVTPLLRLTRINLMRFRRAFGLLAFYTACMHLAAWVWLDAQFDWAGIWAGILKKPFITIGMAAMVPLVPLAATSNNWALRRIGGPLWRRIHWWAYPATLLAAVHFLLVVKAWPLTPMVYLGIVVLLLAWRIRRPVPGRRPAAA